MDYVGLCLVYLHFEYRLYAFCSWVVMITLENIYFTPPAPPPTPLKIISMGMDEKHTSPRAQPGLVLSTQG